MLGAEAGGDRGAAASVGAVPIGKQESVRSAAQANGADARGDRTLPLLPPRWEPQPEPEPEFAGSISEGITRRVCDNAQDSRAAGPASWMSERPG